MCVCVCVCVCVSRARGGRRNTARSWGGGLLPGLTETTKHLYETIYLDKLQDKIGFNLWLTWKFENNNGKTRQEVDSKNSVYDL